MSNSVNAKKKKKTLLMYYGFRLWQLLSKKQNKLLGKTCTLYGRGRWREGRKGEGREGGEREGEAVMLTKYFSRGFIFVTYYFTKETFVTIIWHISQNTGLSRLPESPYI